jgi:6-phosphogluconolactonase
VSPDLIVVADAEAIAREGAGLVREAIAEAIAARGRCAIALAGGRTPRGVYERLADAASTIDWTGVELWFGDERHVPPDHADSNYRMVRESLTGRAPIPAAQVHRLHTEQPDPAAAAAACEDDLRRAFDLGPGQWPVLDLVLLGMGADGHTASLFPGTPVLDERTRLAAAVWVERMHTWRVTLTYPVFNHARHVIVLVSGGDKAAMLTEVLDGPRDLHVRPIQGIDPVDGRLTFLVDQAAAARLKAAPS